MPEVRRVLLSGATGFVGRHLHPVLTAAGFRVVGGTRHPEAARRLDPGREYCELEVRDLDSTLAAMQGCQAAVYLVHAMADSDDYVDAEHHQATTFARAAERAGLSRIVYLGGIRPSGKPSQHLRSRLRTGELLRAGSVSTIELQATMIIGAGSESWRIVRDLAARLPFMALPRWLRTQSQPVYIDDVTAALRCALTLDVPRSVAYPLPGPEVISAREILARTARLMGLQPRMVDIPLITPRLSSYWISLVTRANHRVARQLVEGLRSDIVAYDRGFWRFMPDYTPLGFDEAARRALEAEALTLRWQARLAEGLLHRLTRRAPNV